jgi:hypothetical protein
MRADVSVRAWLPPDVFESLEECRNADCFVRLVEKIITTERERQHE